MIQIYKPGNRNFDKNGDMTLFPTSFMSNDIELGKCWSETLKHPIDEEGRWKYIVNGAIVKAPFYPEGSQLDHDQLYRIIRTEKGMDEIIAELEPVIMQAREDCFLEDVRPTGKTGQQALDIMTAGSIYSGKSDITTANSAYYEKKNLIEALNGDDDNSFVNRWGGEFLPNNFQAVINKRAGGDYGVSVVYGKNISGIVEEVDESEVVTRIYPLAFNGRGISGTGYVDSPLISSYANVKTAVMKFEDVKLAEDVEGTAIEDIVVCNTQEELDQELIARCEAQYVSGIDKPRVTLSIDMVLLQNTEEYKDYKNLESVGLGDTVHCKNKKLGIVTDARVIKMTYNHLTESAESVVLGDYEKNYFDEVTSSTQKIESVINPDGSLMAEKVQGILNGIYTQLRIQNTVAKKVEGRAFLVEDLDEDSDLYGAMVWGTQGLQISTARTADGRGWDWTTAVTAKGIVADAIITGILSDKRGRNYWNLDTGEFRLSAEAFKVDDQTVQDYVDGKIDEKIAQIRTLTMQLSNELTAVATDPTGSGGDYSDAYTDVALFIGTTDITDSDAVLWTVNPSTGVTGSWDPESHRYIVTFLSGDNGTVSISAAYSGLVVTKSFTVVKAKQGIAGPQGGQGIQGSQGDPGPQGPAGEDGKTTYFHIMYSVNPDGNPMTTMPSKYIGTYVDFAQENSTNYKDYTWSRFEGIQGPQGVQGIPGVNGKDGQTSYLHLKYSDDNGITFTENDGETPGKYIGQYVDFVQADSINPARYTWSLARGADGRIYMIQSDAQVLKQGQDGAFTPESIIFSAFYRDGQAATRTPYAGRFVIQETMDGTSYIIRYTSSKNESSHTHTPSSTNVKNIRCILYASDGTANALDMQGVAIVKDIDNLTQEEVFNILTNNGVAQGIYMQDGNLYVNASYLKTGIISDGKGKSSWDLVNGQFKTEDGEFTGKIKGSEITGSEITFTNQNGAVLNVGSLGFSIRKEDGSAFSASFNSDAVGPSITLRNGDGSKTISLDTLMGVSMTNGDNSVYVNPFMGIPTSFIMVKEGDKTYYPVFGNLAGLSLEVEWNVLGTSYLLVHDNLLGNNFRVPMEKI